MPLPPVLRKAVYQHHRRTIGRTGVRDVDGDAVSYIDEPVLDTVQSGQLNHA
jgi:hypothetical protein